MFLVVIFIKNELILIFYHQGVGGSVQYPKQYLKEAFKKVREHGGLCVADEVGTEVKFLFWHCCKDLSDFTREFMWNVTWLELLLKSFLE